MAVSLVYYFFGIQCSQLVAYGPTEAKAYGADEMAPSLYKLPAYAIVFLGMAYGSTGRFQLMGLNKPCPSSTTSRLSKEKT